MDFRKNVSAIILNKNKILIIKKPNQISWAFPQGGIKKGETELEALKRELKEELHLTDFNIIKKSKHIHSYYWPKELQLEKKYLGIKQNVYYLRANKTKLILDKKELEDYKWINIKDLNKFIKYKDILDFLQQIHTEFLSLV